MVHLGPFWPEEVHFGPFRSANRTLAIPDLSRRFLVERILIIVFNKYMYVYARQR